MKTETIEIYKCEHCNKLYQRKHFCEAHEKNCVHNPDNDRACFNCQFLIKKTTEYYSDGVYMKHQGSLNLLYCNKIGIFLYPPKVEHKGNYFELDAELNEPMRRECKLQKKTHFYIED